LGFFNRALFLGEIGGRVRFGDECGRSTCNGHQSPALGTCDRWRL